MENGTREPTETCLFCSNYEGLRVVERNRLVEIFGTTTPNDASRHQVCERCQVNLCLIENGLKLRIIMQQYLTTTRVTGVTDCASSVVNNGNVVKTSPPSQPALFPSPQLVNGGHLPLIPSFSPMLTQPLSPADILTAVSRANPMVSIFGQKEEATDSTSCNKCGVNLTTLDSPSLLQHMRTCLPDVSSEAAKVSTIMVKREKRVARCHKCNVYLKTRSYADGMKHIERCTGQGLPRGRPRTHPEIHRCKMCSKALGSKEQHDLHIVKCDGVVDRRGRKPADNTCMLCNENLVYRHILKKHLRTVHGINAQRLDDSVIAALQMGSPSHVVSKQNVISQIRGKMVEEEMLAATKRSSAHLDTSENGGENSNDVSSIGDQSNEMSLDAADDKMVAGETPTQEKVEVTTAPPIKTSRRKVRPVKYVSPTPTPSIYTCDLCQERFESESEYDRHCCNTIMPELTEPSQNPIGTS